jgi:hypothetical protein
MATGQLAMVAQAHRKEVSHAIESFQELVRNLTSTPPPGSLHPALRALHLVWPQHDVCLNAYGHRCVCARVCVFEDPYFHIALF